MSMKPQAHAEEPPPLLPLEQQYRNTLPSFPQLSRAQERALVTRARAGENVRDDIILSLQPRVYALAAKYWRRDAGPVERMDLVQAANVAMFHSFGRALWGANPITYLLRVARGAMSNCLSGRGDLIKTYRQEDRIALLSLDHPIGEDGTSLADVLAHEVRPAPCLETAVHALCQAIEALPEKQRLVIQRHYGLTTQPESLNRIGRSLAPHIQRPANAHYHNRRALAALRRQLTPLLPLLLGGAL